MFVVALVVLIIAIVTFVFSRRMVVADNATAATRLPKRIGLGAAGVLGALGVVLAFLSCTYTQDAGEAKVLKDWTGNIVGQNNTTGLQFKAPWVDTVTFNIRNQPVVFVTPQEDDAGNNVGGVPDGPQITVQDADGVSSNIDISVRYSIKPAAVTDIYRQFKDEENFKAAFIEQDVRSVVRLVPNDFSTIDLITDRKAVEAGILKALEDRWETDGILVDSISLQEIRPPQSVVDSYAAAQQAQINVTTEQSKLDAAKVSAQQKVVQAQAESDANAILNASLTQPILQQRYLDTLKELAAAGNLVVVPDGFGGIINVAK